MASGKELKALVSIAGKVDPSLSKSLSSATASMKGFGDVAKTVSKVAAVAVTAIATGTIATGKALIDLGNDFKSAQNTIRIGTGAVGEDLKALYGTMKDVYASVPTTLEDASTVIADYNTRLGLTGNALGGLSIQAIQVSDMLGEDVARVVEESSQAFQQWNVASIDMGNAMDYIFKVSQSTGVGFNTLMSEMQSYGAQLQEMGYSFEDAASLMGQLDKAGVNSGEVLKAMKKSVTSLAKEGKSASEGMKQYVDAIKNAGDATEATRIASEVFGARAASTMSIAIRNGTMDVEGLTAALKGSQETINSAAWDTYTFADKWQLVKQNLETAIEPLATSLVDALASAMPYIIQVVDDLKPKIEDFADNLGPRIQDFAENKLPTLVDGVSNLAHGIGEAVTWLSDNWDTISKVGPIIAIAALTIGPLTSAVSGLSSLIPGIVSAIGGMSGKLSSLSAAASKAAPAVSSAGASFATMGGQALLLVAAGAAVLMIAEAMSILANAAISLAQAGPGAVATFVLMAAVGVGVAAAIVAIGSAATVGAIGLIALGAAVLLVGAGIAIAALGAAQFAMQLPTIATYGLEAAEAILAISGAMIVFSGSIMATTLSLIAGTVALATFNVAVLTGLAGVTAFGVAMGVTALASTGLLVALLGIQATTGIIAKNASSAASSLTMMVTAVSVVQSALGTLSDMASSAVSSFLSVFNKATGSAKSTGSELGMALTTGFASGVAGFMASFMTLRVIAAGQLALLREQFANTKLELNRNIALPHFSLKGALDAQNNKIPTVDVKWYAKGGFTNGLSIAGEEGTEAVLSFNRAYRTQNLSYWAKAGQLLGVDSTIIDLMMGKASGSSHTSINLGGVTFSPNVNINGNANKEDVIAAIREEEPEFFDLLDRYIAMKEREAYAY